MRGWYNIYISEIVNSNSHIPDRVFIEIVEIPIYMEKIHPFIHFKSKCKSSQRYWIMWLVHASMAMWSLLKKFIKRREVMPPTILFVKHIHAQNIWFLKTKVIFPFFNCIQKMPIGYMTSLRWYYENFGYRLQSLGTSTSVTGTVILLCLYLRLY